MTMDEYQTAAIEQLTLISTAVARLVVLAENKKDEKTVDLATAFAADFKPGQMDTLPASKIP